MDLPNELLHEILFKVAVSSSRDVSDDDDVIESVLRTLSDVCGRWRDIVFDDAGFFRRQFWKNLVDHGLCGDSIASKFGG